MRKVAARATIGIVAAATYALARIKAITETLELEFVEWTSLQDSLFFWKRLLSALCREQLCGWVSASRP